MTDLCDKGVLRITGMSRSGNHALIHWILRQLQGRWCFLNCAEPGVNPFLSARPMDDGAVHLANDPGFDLARAAAGNPAALDHLVFSHEDVFLKPLFRREARGTLERHVGGWGRWRDVLILRDPYNLFASRRRSGLTAVTPAAAARIWKQHARAFLGRCRGVPRDLIAVSYNRWATDCGYRQEIAAQLGLAFTDAGMEQIPRCLGGSSFDGLAFDGRASSMRVTERWRHYADEPEFRALFDPEMRDLAEEAFGMRVLEPMRERAGAFSAAPRPTI